MGLPQHPFGAGLEYGSTALFDLRFSTCQLDEEVPDLFLHFRPGAQAQVGGHLLTHPAPDGLIIIEVWTVTGQSLPRTPIRGPHLPESGPRQRRISWLQFVGPLPAVLLPGAVWALFLYGVQLTAKHLRKKRIWGPLTESLLMAVMFVPVIVLAVLVAAELELDDRWFSVVTILVGILLGSVVSVPLRQFLLDLGNLPPNPRWEGTDDEL